MIQPLVANYEYLVAAGLSDGDLKQKISQLEEMRHLIEIATERPLAARWQSYIRRQHDNFKDPLFHATLFVVSDELYVLARVYEPAYGGKAWSLSLSMIEGPVSDFHPLTSGGSKERSHFADDTMRGLENDAPTMSKIRALVAVDRWISLLKNRLKQAAPGQPPEAAVNCARDFIGSVAALAQKQRVADYVLPSVDEDPDNQELMVCAAFPTVRQLPQVSFTGWRDDDWGHEYEYLSQETAAIYAGALPTIINTTKTYSTGTSEDWSKEPFGLHFMAWRSPSLPFEPSTVMDPTLSHLPRMPADAIIAPIFSEDQ